MACGDSGGTKQGHRLPPPQNVMALSESFFKPLVAVNQKASGQSFSVALPVQALRRLPRLGFFSVVWCIKYKEGPPG